MRAHHTMPFGAEVHVAGVRFALYAPTARRVDLVIRGRDPLPMTADADGLYTRDVPEIGAGVRYRFRIDGDLLVPDPASRAQPDGIDADGVVVDSRQYEWRTLDWRGRPWREAVIWEAHVGTATPEGTYLALAEKLPDLAAFGITAIQLMPIADCPGTRNWGYDGVLLFAPNNAYGTPDDLRAFIDRAHELGLMVFLDVVYNHFGPAGNYLHAYANTFFTERHPTPWGAGINVDGKAAAMVRRFFIDNAVYWTQEFRFDGLRFDAVHVLRDDSSSHILADIAKAVTDAAGDRHVHLILENEENAAKWLDRDGDGRPDHFTAQWNDDIHHCLHTLITGESDAYYGDFADDPLGRLGRALAEGFVYQGETSKNLGQTRGEVSKHLPPTAFVSFLQNHDQVGNRAVGERIGALASPQKVAFAHEILLLAPQIPMFFMGEEWGDTSPFLFFVDFADDPELSKAVRDGRRKEFSRFAAFSDPERVPDPTAAKTFEASKLHWNERGEGEGAKILAAHSSLLKVRAAEIVPLLDKTFGGGTWTVRDGLLDVLWRFGANALRLVANAGETPRAVTIDKLERVIHGSPTGNLDAWSCLATVRSRG